MAKNEISEKISPKTNEETDARTNGGADGGKPLSASKSGMLTGVLCYLLWGMVPLFWKLLETVDSLDMMLYRIIFSFCFMVLGIFIFGPWRKIFSGDLRLIWERKKQVIYIVFAGVIVATNWWIYIFSLNHGMAQEASLGYFINPLFNFIFAVIFLGEKMRGMVLLSCAAAVIGVALITIQTGVLPLPSLGLALTFSVYGIIKKKVAVSPISSITLEALVVLPVALIYVLAFSKYGFLTYPAHINLLIASAGIVTAIPLLLFSDAARKLPYITIGFLQYMSPTITFLIAIFIFRENISLLKFLGFCFIWAAILIFSAASIRRK